MARMRVVRTSQGWVAVPMALKVKMMNWPVRWFWREMMSIWEATKMRTTLLQLMATTMTDLMMSQNSSVNTQRSSKRNC